MLSTGNINLDKYFTYSNSINCIYGKAATGKTNLCLLLASKTAKNKRVFFLDTENSFSTERIKQFEKENVLNNIFVIKINDFNEQTKAIENLLKIKNKIDVVILDSLSMHYRTELKENPNANNQLSKQLNILSELTRANIPVIITSQVYTKFDNSTQPVGGNMIKNWSKCLIKLENEHQRTLFLEKHPLIGSKTLNFEIKEETIFPL